MSEVELWVTDRFGNRIAPLPEANIGAITWDLNLPGSFKLEIDPLSEGAAEIEGIVREIQVWIDGTLRMWGVPWGIDGNSQSISVECEGLLSLFTKRFVDRMSMLYTSIDQFSIAWDLLNYAQSESVEANRNLNINSANFGLSGVNRSRNWPRDEHEMILDCLNEFDSRTLDNGFDWEVTITGDGGRFWMPYYPRKGAPKPNAAVEWDSGGERNISDFSWSEDFLTVKTLAYVTGGSVSTGGTSIKKEGKYESIASSAYWGQMQAVISEGSQLDEDWLADRAKQEVESGDEPEMEVSITSVVGLETVQLGDVVVGDWVPVTIDHGRIQVEGWHRVESVTWNPNGTIDLDFTGEVIP